MWKHIKKMAAVLLAVSLAVPFCGTGTDAGKSHVAKAAGTSGDDGSAGLTEIPNLSATSVDGKIEVKIWKNSLNRYFYSAYRDGNVTLKCAPLGLVATGADLSKGLTLDESSIQKTKGKEDYDWIQGSQSHVTKDYQEMSFVLTHGTAQIKMIFRLFNDGIAYRYEVDGNTASTAETTEITSEESSFEFPQTANIWTMGVSSTYEAGNYTSRKMSSVTNMNENVAPPILCKLPNGDSNYWMLLAEANVYNEEAPYCACNFRTSSGSAAFKVHFGPYLTQETDETLDGQRYDPVYADIESVKMKDKFHTPWRLAIMTDNLEDLVNSSLVSDLNPDPEGDFSWVEPGTSSWSWWSTGDPINYESMYDYIDYAQETGQKYCLIDFGWENWSDYEKKIKDLVAYAEPKGVKLIAWYGVNKFDQPHKFDLDNPDEIEKEFAWCEKMGLKGVKVDYLNSDSQFAMKVMYDIASIAAKHKLIVNYHGCTDPNGENRTFPNILSSEAVMGAEYFKWGSGMPVQSLLMLPYARNVIGSMEFTPVCASVQGVSATDGFMLAMAVVYESAIQTLAHSCHVYPGYGGLSLLTDIPSSWDESRLIGNSEPGSSVIRARRSGETWYVGAMTRTAGDYEIPLGFLEPNTKYYAYLYTDREDGTGIQVEKQEVTSQTTISTTLKNAGGCALKITKNENLRSTVYDNYNYYEAENAKIGPDVSIIDTNKAKYVSGKKYVDKIKGTANNIAFQNIEVPEAGLYDVNLYIVSSGKKTLNIRVNHYETTVLTGLIGIQGFSTAVGCIPTQLYLDKGKNTIYLYNPTTSAPAIDRIAVSKTAVKQADPPAVTDTDPELYVNEEKEPEQEDKPSDKPSDKPADNPADKPGDNKQPDNTKISAPAKVTIRSVKSKKKRQLTVKYKAVKDVSGYQISYGTNKKFKKAKTASASAKAVSKTIKKLKSKKRYYVRVRAFRMDGTKKLPGKWSAAKNVKVK